MDRFYTPKKLALKLTDAVGVSRVNSCGDPNCGHGQLLLSAEAQWPEAEFWGLDIDRRAVQRVRRRRPRWTVSVGNLLSPHSVVRTHVFRNRSRCDVLLTNPPFSMGAGKGVVRTGVDYRSSVAMAHILAAIELFRPKYAVGAIVPESLLYSELDQAAREYLGKTWALEEALCVPQSSFKGTRAHAALVVMRPHNGEGRNGGVVPTGPAGGVAADLVRGGLPVHEALLSAEDGVPFVHSTDLAALANGSYRTKAVFPLGRGCVVGAVILLPRVGVPSVEHIAPLEFERPVQLSDCVIGLRFSSNEAARRTAEMIRGESESLVGLYRGTGARYVTVRRVEDWCVSIGVEPYRTSLSTGRVLAGAERPRDTVG